MRTLTVGLLLAVVAAGTAADDKKADPAKGEKVVWLVTSMERDGKKVPADEVKKLDIRLTVEESGYTVTEGGKVIDRGTAKASSVKDKRFTLDIMPQEGPYKGKTILAIAEVEGDTMRVCYDMNGKVRPKDFTTREGTGHICVMYKRAK